MSNAPEETPGTNLAENLELLSRLPVATFMPAAREILKAAAECSADNGGVIGPLDLFIGVLTDPQCQNLAVQIGIPLHRIEKLLNTFLPNRPHATPEPPPSHDPTTGKTG